MYMLSIDWLFTLHCIVCFPAFLLQFSRSPGMKRAHRQAEPSSLQKPWTHIKQQNAEVALWSWKESAGIRRPGPDGNSMYCLLLREAEGKRTPVCMLGEQFWCQGQDRRPRSKPSVMYEQLTNEQNIVRMTAYTVCCGRAALSHLFQYCGGVQGWTGPQVECYSGVLAMELGVEVSTGFIGGMALWLKYSTTCLGTSARTHFARAAGEACKSHTFIGLHEGGDTH